MHPGHALAPQTPQTPQTVLPLEPPAGDYSSGNMVAFVSVIETGRGNVQTEHSSCKAFLTLVLEEALNTRPAA